MEEKKPRLTKKTARALARKVFGTFRGLAEVKFYHNCFEMPLGEMRVTILPDLEKKDRIAVFVRNVNSCNRAYYMLFDPETLEEDSMAELACKREDWLAQLRKWVQDIGPEQCKKRIDELWAER